jgi:hypothetical protein
METGQFNFPTNNRCIPKVQETALSFFEAASWVFFQLMGRKIQHTCLNSGGNGYEQSEKVDLLRSDER